MLDFALTKMTGNACFGEQMENEEMHGREC